MELELEGWKAKAALVALAVVVVVSPLACSVRSNKDRADDWRRRAIVAEESVGGLRAVIVERSRALNQRTVQANQLVGALRSNRVALRRTKLNAGELARRQQALTTQNARIENDRRQLQNRQATLAALASNLSACTKGLAGALDAGRGKTARAVVASARARLASCRRASARLDAYLERSG
jgi:chromosome segregation ATPase